MWARREEYISLSPCFPILIRTRPFSSSRFIGTGHSFLYIRSVLGPILRAQHCTGHLPQGQHTGPRD